MLIARLAKAADLDVVKRMTNASYAEYEVLFGGPPLPMTEDYRSRIAANQVWLVSRDDTDVALAVLETLPEYLMIFSLAVLPEARGGTGRWLLAFAEERARAAGVPEIRLYTNARMERNIRVYGQAGYIETGRRPHDLRPGWLLVDMVKSL